MDNVNSQASIKPPAVPSDAEVASGTTRTDLIAYILELVSKGQVAGLNQESPTSLDITNLQTEVEALKTKVASLESKQAIHTDAAGVNGAVVTVPIPGAPIASNLYDVDMAFVGGSGAIPTGLRWSVVDGSKTTSEFQVRVEGDATAYSLHFTITPH